jgi:hypothetical protein
MEASLEPLWPGSMKTTMPAILEGTAFALGVIAVDAAASAPTTNLIPTRLLTRRSTAQR